MGETEVHLIETRKTLVPIKGCSELVNEISEPFQLLV